MPLESPNVGRLPVYFGGPVQTDRGFVLHRPVGNWQSTLAVTSEVGLTSSRDVLQAVGKDGQPGEIMVTLGYSGWWKWPARERAGAKRLADGAGRSAHPS